MSVENDKILHTRVKIRGKEKLIPRNSIGYIFSISNKCTDKIYFYVKDITVYVNKHKTDMDFTNQLTTSDIKSLDDLINTNGVFASK